VGVRAPASLVSETTATLNGSVLSTTGGPGSYDFGYGPTSSPQRRTPERPIDFEAEESEQVSEPVEGLQPGTVYRYYVCAEDGETPGDKFCSPPQTFRTAGASAQTFLVEAHCSNPDDFAQSGTALNFEPNSRYGIHFEFLEGGSGGGTTAFTTDENGNANAGDVFFTGPFRISVRVWANPDGDLVQDPGEETVVDEVYAADEPCTDAQPEQPT
jgi:hypothetical protein